MMNLLRNLITMLSLVSCVAAFAQNLVITGSFGPGGAVDVVTRSLGKEMGTILGKRYYVNNVGGEFGTRAIREFRSAPADGSSILVFHVPSGQAVPDLGGLVPVATIVGETAGYRWVGVFAPNGTPSNIVDGLERAVVNGLNSPGYKASVESFSNPITRKAMFTPTPGNREQLARLVAQSTGGGSASVSGSLGPSSSIVSSPTGTLPQDGACNFAGFNQKIAEWTRQNPQKSNWGMNDTYRYSYFFGFEGLKILEKYRTCMSDEDFAANYQALKGARDKGREGCLKTSSTGDCQPSYSGSSTSPIVKPSSNCLSPFVKGAC